MNEVDELEKHKGSGFPKPLPQLRAWSNTSQRCRLLKIH